MASPTNSSADSYVNQPPIEHVERLIDSSRIEAFRKATHTESRASMPASFPTIFRRTEFEWLSRMGVDMRRLLHTDQEYEYFEPLREGDIPTISTRVKSLRERSGMRLVTLETAVKVGGREKIRATTQFVVRAEAGQ